MKKIYLLAITFVIAGLMITSSAVSVTTTKTNLTKDDNNFCVASLKTKLLNKIPATGISSLYKTLVGPDVPVFQTEDTNRNPAIDTDRFGSILTLSEKTVDGTATSLLGRWSKDYGATWSDDAYGWNFNNANTLPKLDAYGKGKIAWGTIFTAPETPGYIYYIGFPDITDPTVPDLQNPDGWTAWYADWGSNGYTINSADVACYSNTSNIPSPEFWGVVACTADVEGQYSEDNTMIFSYFAPEQQIQSIYFYNMDQDLRKMTTDIDQVTGKLYLCMEYYNHPTKPNGTIIYYNGGIKANENWWQSGWNAKTLTGVLNPDIGAENKFVYIVGEMMNTTNNNTDIVCYHSSNSGNTFTKTFVSTDPALNETFPKVSVIRKLAGGYTIICSYTKNGSYYASTSIDNGATWTPVSTSINDVAGKVIESYESTSVGGPYAAWTDARENKTGIYFDSIITPERPPVLGITSVKGPIGVTAVIKNTGEAAAHNVTWEINVLGGLLGLISKVKTDKIPILASGADESVKLGLVFGFGSITITVSATCDEGSFASTKLDGTNLLFLTLVKSG